MKEKVKKYFYVFTYLHIYVIWCMFAVMKKEQRYTEYMYCSKQNTKKKKANL